MEKKAVLHYFHIAFCICCMNRTHQLEETLLQNIQDNDDYDKLEFILLDYNSTDHMEVWVKNCLSKYIDSGRLKYYKTDEPVFFNHSHAKNLVFKLSDADIVCNINCDHYTGKGFANFINDAYNENPDIVITPIPADIYNKTLRTPPSELWGKVCVKKSDFLAVGGFDERMIKYGNDDIDFINRLAANGTKKNPLIEEQFWKYISHGDEIRHSSKEKVNKVVRVLVNYNDPASSTLIFLFIDGHFEHFTVIDNTLTSADNYFYSFHYRDFNYLYSIKDLNWLIGSFIEHSDHLILNYLTGTTNVLDEGWTAEVNVFEDKNKKIRYHVLTDVETINAITTLDYVYYNLNIMLKNLSDKIIKVNNGCFGEAKVYKNFDYKTPIVVN